MAFGSKAPIRTSGSRGSKSAFQNLERLMRCPCEASDIVSLSASSRLRAPQLQTFEREF